MQVNFLTEQNKFSDFAFIKQVAAGRHHSLLLTGNGKVYGCGRTQSGELGLPLTEMHQREETFDVASRIEKGIQEFMQIYTLSSANVSKIFAGGFHSFVVLNHLAPRRPKRGKEMVIEKHEIVYTDSSLCHRFLRFSVPISSVQAFQKHLKDCILEWYN